MFNKILVAIDGSKYAEKAFEKAIDMARASGGMLVVLHVLQLPPTIGYGKKLSAEVETLFRKDAKIFLAEHAEKATLKGIQVDTVLAKGSPAQAILHAADSTGADLIVIGGRGLGGVKGLFLGSVLHAVAQRAGVPVLVAR